VAEGDRLYRASLGLPPEEEAKPASEDESEDEGEEEEEDAAEPADSE
jgi:hypothetical protein